MTANVDFAYLVEAMNGAGASKISAVRIEVPY